MPFTLSRKSISNSDTIERERIPSKDTRSRSYNVVKPPRLKSIFLDESSDHSNSSYQEGTTARRNNTLDLYATSASTINSPSAKSTESSSTESDRMIHLNTHKWAGCIHGRRRYECRDCGGSRICSHGRRKSECKDCGGINICEHGKHKRYCAQCDGSRICPHKRQKAFCKQCGGSAICGHNRVKYSCKRCKIINKKICDHGSKIVEDCQKCADMNITGILDQRVVVETENSSHDDLD